MEKTPRYTQRERNMVLGYAAQYKDVIENKRTDAESNRKKDEVWRQIAKEFNARVYHQRTSKQLRQLYKNMKLLLKKDLCGEGKGNRSFMDLLNTLSQQESVAQYIAEQMSPTGSYNSGRPQKYDEDYDDNKMASRAFSDAMDTGVIVIKSEEMSDNDQTSHNGDMDDDDDDCLSTKDIPEVCLEEEDDEIFMADLRQTLQQRSQLHISSAQNSQQQSNQQQQHQQQQSTPQQPEVTIQNVGGIRVGSIGSMANLQLKALQNSLSNYTSHSNSNSSINNNNNNNNNINNNNNNNNPAISITQGNSNNSNVSNHVNQRQTQQLQQQQQSAAEQAQQHLLLNGLGLSAVVHQPTMPATSTPSSEHAAAGGLLSTLPALQRAGLNSSANNTNGLSAAANQILMSLNGGGGNINYGHKSASHKDTLHNNSGSSGHNSSGSSSNARHNDYLMSLAIEERKRKIDLLNAQIDYWKTLTKMLDANGGHNPTPACLCHFPGKVNGLQTQTSSS